jgi:hypothetical protein
MQVTPKAHKECIYSHAGLRSSQNLPDPTNILRGTQGKMHIPADYKLPGGAWWARTEITQGCISPEIDLIPRRA